MKEPRLTQIAHGSNFEEGQFCPACSTLDVGDLCFPEYQAHMKTLDYSLTDRGSKYAVSGAPCASEAEAKTLLKSLKRDKKFAKATHNTWALLGERPIKNDDGESGAGNVILRMLEREGLKDHLIVVTRWYGGKHLGGDRFRHVQTCVRAYLDHLAQES